MKELSKDQENLIEAFKEYLRKKNMSKNTERAYIRTVRQLLFASEDLSEDSPLISGRRISGRFHGAIRFPPSFRENIP